MAQIIGIQGVGLPTPLALYPVTTGVPPIPGLAATNGLSLAPGGAILVPSGTFWVNPGQYSTIQVKDPVTQTWAWVSMGDFSAGQIIQSDGENYRIWNPLGFPICAVVNVSGSGYTSAPTVAASIGGSTWTAVLGPALSALVCASTNTTASGVGYSMPPNINIAAPPAPGVQATAICTVSGGKIATFTILNPGGGYTSLPTVVATPNPLDLNFASSSTTATTAATITAQTSYGGQLCAVLLANPGTQPLSVSPALTFSGGGGSGALATAVVAKTVTAVTVVSGGNQYSVLPMVYADGGSIFAFTSGTGQALVNSPIVSTLVLNTPRRMVMQGVAGSANGVQVGVIIDGGIFTDVPTVYAVGGDGTFRGTPTMGTANDTIFVTPL